MFILEALQAKKGDSLLLHFGTKTNPRLVVIDGGPNGVYKSSLKRRLAGIMNERGISDNLPIDMVMVSHLDNDHIRGILDMTSEMIAAGDKNKSSPYAIGTLWHNSFDDVIGNDPSELLTSMDSAIKVAGNATFPRSLPIRRDTALVLSSINEGRELRDNANRLGLIVNDGGVVPKSKSKPLIVAPDSGALTYNLGEDLTFQVIAPSVMRVQKLQEEWDKFLGKKGLAQAALADYADNSVFNLSSIVVVATVGKKRMLLTGDARGDDIIKGLAENGFMVNGKCHFDLLKIPHHGSDNNVETDFFRVVTADHYVFSGDGEHGNPELATFRMLSDARQDDKFTIHLTNLVLPKEKKASSRNKLIEFFQCEQNKGRKYAVNAREENELSVKVTLLK